LVVDARPTSMLVFSAFLISFERKLWMRPFLTVSPLISVCSFFCDGLRLVASASYVISLIFGRLRSTFIGEVSVLQASRLLGITSWRTWLRWVLPLVEAPSE